VPPHDFLEDLPRVLVGIERGENGVHRARPDRLSPFDELDELVDHRAGLADARIVALERQAIPAQEQGDAEAVTKRVEDAVVDRGELGRDLVGNRENFLQQTEFSEAGGAARSPGATACLPPPFSVTLLSARVVRGMRRK
jgi:hypothetical protein